MLGVRDRHRRLARDGLAGARAKTYNSPALASNALHFASDLLGSVAVLIGLLVVRAGYAEGDAIAALVVAVLVIAAAVRLARRNVEVLMDQRAGGGRRRGRAPGDRARASPTSTSGACACARRPGAYFVDAVVGVRPDAAVGQGHALADAVEAAVRRALAARRRRRPRRAGRRRATLRERVNAAALAVRGVREVHNVRVMDGRRLPRGRRCTSSCRRR